MTDARNGVILDDQTGEYIPRRSMVTNTSSQKVLAGFDPLSFCSSARTLPLDHQVWV